MATQSTLEIPHDRQIRFERRPSQRFPARKTAEATTRHPSDRLLLPVTVPTPAENPKKSSSNDNEDGNEEKEHHTLRVRK